MTTTRSTRCLKWACCIVLACLIPACGPSQVVQSDPPSGGDSKRTVVPRTSEASSETEPSLADVIANTRALARAGRFAAAEQSIATHLRAAQTDPELWELSADVAVANQSFVVAVERYRQAVACSVSPSAQLLDKLGRQYMQIGQPFDAIMALQQLVQEHPDDQAARRDLAGLLCAMALERQAGEHLQYLVQRGLAGVSELIILTDLTRPQTDEAICKYALEKNPGDLRPLYALRRMECYAGKWDVAVEDLRRVWQRHPEFVPGSAFYIRALVETYDADPERAAQLAEWVDRSGEDVKRHPQYWIASGIWAERQEGPEQAVSAFAEAVRLAPNDGEALNRLANALAQSGQGKSQRELTQRVADRARAINQMRDDVESLFSWRNHSQRAAIKIARSMQRLGRPWEAASWARVAVPMTQDPDGDARAVFDEIRSGMTGRTPWMLAEARVAEALDLSDYPNTQWQPDMGDRREVEGDDGAAIHFVDQAAERRLDHVCKIAAAEKGQSGLWIYQSGAGGAGVLDFDLDGWPDLYLTACDGKPLEHNSSTNRLYRNRSGAFSDCTTSAQTVDQDYSQGVAVGDFDCDGFPDLFVGNYGQNRLLRNNGDGTFQDVTKQWGLEDARWTTSVAIADLNGDGHADLFEVNYVGSDEVLTQKCFPDGMTEHRSCGPLVFPAQSDHVWLGSGASSFENTTSQCLTAPNESVTPGRGLGVVVGMLDNREGMDVYVANDMSANHFWSASGDAQKPFHFSEQATLRGVAFNQQSLSQASMGIAADDADNDGDLDFYVTHFTDDYNTLYLQASPGIWTDVTAKASLVQPTRSMLGYGTQWIDADNDGVLELMVANGHVDDFTHSGLNYRMPLQLFRRQSDGRYGALAPELIGEAFATKRLARSLATLDVNRDQKLDCVVTELFDPVSLLVNDSSANHHAVTVELVGVTSHRDAIGARVRLIADGETADGRTQVRNAQTHCLLAGNGYQCSNERKLHFGFTDASDTLRLMVTWPDGSEQIADGVHCDTAYRWIQGQSQPEPIEDLPARVR